MTDGSQPVGEEASKQNAGQTPLIVRWYVVCIGLVLFDQITKFLIRQNMEPRESIQIIGDDFLRLTYVQNRGIAFGMEFIGRPLLIVMGIAAIVFLTFYLAHLIRSRNLYRWPVLLFLAGALGNTIDRVWFGRVTDFVDVDFPDFIMERWPVFNVADSCVTIGMVVMILILMFEHKEASVAGERHRDTPHGGELGIIPAVEDHVRPFSSHEGRISSPTDPLPRDDRSRPKPTAD